MKRILFSLLITISVALSSNAQLNNFSVGDAAPDFTITDIHGHTHTLSTYINAGKSVLIDFFYTTCGPCQNTAPKVNDFYHKYGCNTGDIIVLGIDNGDSDAQVLSFENTYTGTNPYPSISGTEGGGDAVVATYGPSAFPTVCLIGSDGKFKNVDLWPIGGISDIEAAFTNASISLTPMNCPASIEENISVSEIEIFPNPASYIANISFNAQSGRIIKTEVFNIIGAKLYESEMKSLEGINIIELFTAEFVNGQYIIRITIDETKVFTKKLNIIK